MEKNHKIELPLHIHDEKNGLNYTLHGDYYLPDIEVDPGQPIGKYGRARLRYLQEHRSIMYNRLLLSGKLYDDLHRADEEAERLLDTMLSQMAKDAGVTEMLKASDPMKWVGMMNAIKAQVEEIIWNELIYT
ncbi:MAG: TnpV protein [Lachnospiraceae bacterium]|nr:TnpV protein [Lachnospiraceae bacterium]